MFFEKKVDRRSRKAMVEFLQNHYRYNTMSSVNRSTSYAHCVKLHRLGLTKVQDDKAWDMLDVDYWDDLQHLITEFTARHNGHYAIGSNGRSSGYLVLYQSQYEATGHKSYCTHCGQRSFASAVTVDMEAPEGIIYKAVIGNAGCWRPEVYLEQSAIQSIELTDAQKLAFINQAKVVARNATIGNKCGRCGNDSRVNYAKEPMKLSVWAGRSIDQDEEFHPDEWSMSQLRERVDLVCDFDRTVDTIRDAFIDMLDTQCVEEVTVMVPKKVKRLVACGAAA